MPYLWRRLNPAQRKELLAYRKLMRRPWHRPPHFEQGIRHFLLTAACYEHRVVIGRSAARMAEFSMELLKVFDAVVVDMLQYFYVSLVDQLMYFGLVCVFQ